MAGLSSSEAPVAPGAPFGQSSMMRGAESLAEGFWRQARAGSGARSKVISGRAAQSFLEIIESPIHTAPVDQAPDPPPWSAGYISALELFRRFGSKYMLALKTDQSAPLRMVMVFAAIHYRTHPPASQFLKTALTDLSTSTRASPLSYPRDRRRS